MPFPARIAAALLLLGAGEVGCSRLYPPVVEGASAAAASSPAEGAGPRARGARIRLLSADDPDYVALAATGVTRAVPEASERLVVLRDGVPVVDLGIHMVTADEQGRALVEEQAAIADDGSAAVIVRIERRPRTEAGLIEQSTIRWLPAGDPQQAWKKTLDPGRRVLLALPVPAARGLVLVTAVPDSADDLRVYGASGTETFHLTSAAASVIELRASASGRYVGADLAYASRPGAPDRAVWVHDLAARTAWTHGWNYGSDEEVIAWRLLEDGTLEADTAGFTLQIGPGDRVFDRSRRRS